MDYSDIEAADLADVRSLNFTFVEFLTGRAGGRLRSALPRAMRPVVTAMQQRHIDRLAAVPFLLASCREHDASRWPPVVEVSPLRDLFAPSGDADNRIRQLAAATLGFLWQLARKNPYAARTVSGATDAWCEQLAAYPLFYILQRANEEPELILPRLANDEIFWWRLLGAGLSSNVAVRRAAHLSALQTVLTPGNASPPQRLRSAACRSNVPVLQVREQSSE